MGCGKWRNAAGPILVRFYKLIRQIVVSYIENGRIKVSLEEYL
jgi:hypothetical protein